VTYHKAENNNTVKEDCSYVVDLLPRTQKDIKNGAHLAEKTASSTVETTAATSLALKLRKSGAPRHPTFSPFFPLDLNLLLVVVTLLSLLLFTGNFRPCNPTIGFIIAKYWYYCDEKNEEKQSREQDSTNTPLSFASFLRR